MFAQALKNTLITNQQFNNSTTENGAIGYRTTGKALLDINFKIASLRNASEDTIIDLFMKALYEDKNLAVKWLFYASDVRGGVGERRLFKIILKHLAHDHPGEVSHLLQYVSEYSRWDNLWGLLDTGLANALAGIVDSQLKQDITNMRNNKPISLLAKWLPSTNTSSVATRNTAKRMRQLLGMNEAVYRKTLSRLRQHIDVVECKMSANQWGEINYEAVPSKANLLYNNAFLRNDETRRRKFLEALERGEATINSSVAFPHDIVHRYCNHWNVKSHDPTLEAMWKGLPDIVDGAGNTIVVADGSGSMGVGVGGTGVTALSVANALAIYFAEKSSGQFKNKYITFSHRPQLVDFNHCNSLREKLEVARLYTEVAGTNIEAVFDIILATAIRQNMTQSDVPENIVIVSDMEFNDCARGNSGELSQNLFTIIASKYNAHGYRLPRLVFWNVNSRTGTVPVIENELGVALVSGFSPNIAKMVLSNNLDPYQCLVEQLLSERYEPIELPVLPANIDSMVMNGAPVCSATINTGMLLTDDIK